MIFFKIYHNVEHFLKFILTINIVCYKKLICGRVIMFDNSFPSKLEIKKKNSKMKSANEKTKFFHDDHKSNIKLDWLKNTMHQNIIRLAY